MTEIWRGSNIIMILSDKVGAVLLLYNLILTEWLECQVDVCVWEKDWC